MPEHLNKSMEGRDEISEWSSRLLSNTGPLHFFTHRTGGVSLPPFDSLNLGLGTQDEASRVHKNREIVERRFHLPLRALARQVHKDQDLVLRRGTPLPKEAVLPAADAIVTDVPGLALAMFFADCLPIFFWDPVRHAAGLAHAGWRSTILDIGPLTVDALSKAFGSQPEDLQTALGPSIGPCCFEVGPDVADKFRKKFGLDIIQEKNSGLYVDLWKSNQSALEKKGVKGGNMEL